MVLIHSFYLLAFGFTYFVVPEMAGRTLEEMDKEFNDVSIETEEQ